MASQSRSGDFRALRPVEFASLFTKEQPARNLKAAEDFALRDFLATVGGRLHASLQKLVNVYCNAGYIYHQTPYTIIDDPLIQDETMTSLKSAFAGLPWGSNATASLKVIEDQLNEALQKMLNEELPEAEVLLKNVLWRLNAAREELKPIMDAVDQLTMIMKRCTKIGDNRMSTETAEDNGKRAEALKTWLDTLPGVGYIPDNLILPDIVVRMAEDHLDRD